MYIIFICDIHIHKKHVVGIAAIVMVALVFIDCVNMCVPFVEICGACDGCGVVHVPLMVVVLWKYVCTTCACDGCGVVPLC